MPLTSAVDREQRRVRLHWIDSMTADDVIAALDRQADEGVGSYGSIADYTGVSWAPSPSDVQRFLLHVEALSQLLGHAAL